MAVRDVVVPAQRFDALLLAVGALEGAIDDGTLADVAIAILPPHDDVQHEVQRPETFEALRLAPHVYQAGDRNELVDEVERFRAWLQFGERDQAKAPALRRSALTYSPPSCPLANFPNRRSPIPPWPHLPASVTAVDEIGLRPWGLLFERLAQLLWQAICQLRILTDEPAAHAPDRPPLGVPVPVLSAGVVSDGFLVASRTSATVESTLTPARNRLAVVASWVRWMEVSPGPSNASRRGASRRRRARRW